MTNLRNSRLKVAVAGLGAIGAKVVKELDRGMDGLVLSAVAVQNAEKHRGWLGGLTTTPELVPVEALAEAADIVVECAPSRLVRTIVAPVVTRGKTAIVLSAGALLENDDLIALARDHGGQVVVPTGALIGLDAMTDRGGGNDSFGTDGLAQADRGAAWRTASGREQYQHRRDYRTAPDL